QAQGAQAAAPDGLGAILVASLSEEVGKISDAFVTTATAILDLPRAIAWAAQQATDPVVQAYWLEVILKIAVVLLLSIDPDMLTIRLLARAHRALEARHADRVWLRVPLMVAR